VSRKQLLDYYLTHVADAERDIEAGHNAGMTTLVAMFGYLIELDRPETSSATA